MREVVVLSGKCGTGKTGIVGAFAAIAQTLPQALRREIENASHSFNCR